MQQTYAPALSRAESAKITPIGSHPGELRANDRASIFGDPTGMRMLHNPAHDMTGGG